MSQKSLNIPNTKKLLKAYNFMQGAGVLDEKAVIEYALWSRFDPRLGEVLVAELNRQWLQLNPILLRELNLKSIYPQVLAVVLDHVAEICADHTELFQLFRQIVVLHLAPVDFQSYFVGVYKLAGGQVREQAQRPHPMFSRWGFYAADPMWSKSVKTASSTFYKPAERRRILRHLLQRQSKITVNDYLEACRYAIHRRQAERDLKTFFKLKATGNTRGRYYQRR